MSYSRNNRDDAEPALLKLWRDLGGDWYEAPPLDGWAISPLIRYWVPVEIKTPGAKEKRFQPKQLSFTKRCDINRWPYWVWKTDDDVLRCRGARRAA